MTKNVVLLLVILSAGALGMAYVMQYGFGMEPCRLCYWQRYPYVAVIAFGVIGLFTGRYRPALVLIAAMLVLDVGIAAYHASIELGIVELPAGCAATIGTTMQDMMASLAKPPAQCDRPAFMFLGLSLSMWNAIAAATMAFLALYVLTKSAAERPLS